MHVKNDILLPFPVPSLLFFLSSWFFLSLFFIYLNFHFSSFVSFYNLLFYFLFFVFNHSFYHFSCDFPRQSNSWAAMSYAVGENLSPNVTFSVTKFLTHSEPPKGKGADIRYSACNWETHIRNAQVWYALLKDYQQTHDLSANKRKPCLCLSSQSWSSFC